MYGCYVCLRIKGAPTKVSVLASKDIGHGPLPSSENCQTNEKKNHIF